MAILRLTCENSSCLGHSEEGMVVKTEEETTRVSFTRNRLGDVATLNYVCELCGDEGTKTYPMEDDKNPNLLPDLLFEGNPRVDSIQA